MASGRAFRIRIFGAKRASSRMKKRSKGIKSDKRIGIKKTMIVMFQRIAKNFDFPVGHGHKPPIPWKPLAPSTRKEKAKKGLSPLPLTRSGLLKQSWIIKATNNSGTLTSTAASKKGVFYGKFHDRGTKHIPKRRILLTEKYAGQIAVQQLGKFIKTKIEIR